MKKIAFIIISIVVFLYILQFISCFEPSVYNIYNLKINNNSEKEITINIEKNKWEKSDIIIPKNSNIKFQVSNKNNKENIKNFYISWKEDLSYFIENKFWNKKFKIERKESFFDWKNKLFPICINEIYENHSLEITIN